MGTNYYLHRKPPCATCGKPDEEPLHIGKSSGGWCFSLHVIPEDGIHDLGDWRREWNQPGSVIMNEYGERVPVSEMDAEITERKWKRNFEGKWWGSPVGFTGLEYASEAAFHRKNHSERGPNGLLRHAIGDYCVGHGEGTWDYIPGDFS